MQTAIAPAKLRPPVAAHAYLSCRRRSLHVPGFTFLFSNRDMGKMSCYQATIKTIVPLHIFFTDLS
jgi:hypothetical protein